MLEKKPHSCFYHLQMHFIRSHFILEIHSNAQPLQWEFEQGSRPGRCLWRRTAETLGKILVQVVKSAGNTPLILHICCSASRWMHLSGFLGERSKHRERWTGKEGLRRWHGTATITCREKVKRGKKAKRENRFRIIPNTPGILLK